MRGRERPFKAPTKNVMQLANLYPQYFQMVVLDESGIRTPATSGGKGVAVQPKGNTAELLTRQVLQTYGLSYKEMGKVSYVSYSDAVELMKDKHADSLHSYHPYPPLPSRIWRPTGRSAFFLCPMRRSGSCRR